MKQLKKLILFLVLFLFVICLKITVFGVTLTEIEYNGVTYKPDVEPLTLQTTTNSYIVGISNDLTRITVVEPYNSDDYLISYTQTLFGSGTYNRLAGYSIKNKAKTDINVYNTNYSDGSWTSWRKSTTTHVGHIAPR